MKIKNLLLTSAVVAASAAANASPIYIDLGAGKDFNGDGDGQTGVFQQLGYTGTLATSIYALDVTDPSNPQLAGTVVDTNIQSVMDAYGFGAIAGTANPVGGTNGTPLKFQYPAFPAQNGFNALNPLCNPEGFSCSDDTERYGDDWILSYEYVLEGTVSVTDISFTSGYFNVFYHDSTGVSFEQVAKISVTGSQLLPANLNIMGEVTFDFDGDGIDNDASAFAKNFMHDATTGTSFYDIWTTGGDSAISFLIDTNVNPPIPNPASLVVTTDGAGGIYGIRQSTLDGSAEFNVPEPSSIALLGLGLLGLGATARRKA